MNIQTLNLLLCLLILLPSFFIGWYFCFRTKVFAWLDLFWGLSFIVVLIVIQATQYLREAHFSIRLLDFMYLIWSLRLSTHLFTRIKKSGEDRRYLAFKKKWKVWYGLRFFILFQTEAILTLVLALPLFLTYNSEFDFLKLISVIVFLVAIVGEALSDIQLKKFIEKNKERSKVCNTGLWKYSRHPNYFFEWLSWIAFAIYGLTSVEKWPALIPATLMYFILTKVTGIPPAEESSLESKKENYTMYQKQTNAFFPWFPKKVLILLFSIIAINPSNSFAAGASMQQQEKMKNVFNTLRADNIQILDDFYDPKVTFIDPLGMHPGIDSVKSYYKNLYKNVKEINFKFKNIISSGNSHVLIWTMTLKADGLNGGVPIVVEGNSHIEFNDKNLVIYHRDYFDMGEFIYEHVPVLSFVIKQIKTRLKESSK